MRFSVRALLVGVACVAIGLAVVLIVATRHQRAREQRQLSRLIVAAQKIGTCGGTLDYEPASYPFAYLAHGAFDIRGGKLSIDAAQAICESPVSEFRCVNTDLSPEVDQVISGCFSKSYDCHLLDPLPSGSGEAVFYLRHKF